MDDMQNSGSVPEQQPPMTPPPVPNSAEASVGKSEPTPAPQEAPVPRAVPVAAQMSDARPPTSASGERRGMAAVGYLGIFCIIPLVFARESAFAQYHAKQGLILAVAFIVTRSLHVGMLWMLPFGGALGSFVTMLIIVLSIVGIIKALRGEKFDVPYISEWAAKIHF